MGTIAGAQQATVCTSACSLTAVHCTSYCSSCFIPPPFATAIPHMPPPQKNCGEERLVADVVMQHHNTSRSCSSNARVRHSDMHKESRQESPCSDISIVPLSCSVISVLNFCWLCYFARTRRGLNTNDVVLGLRYPWQRISTALQTGHTSFNSLSSYVKH